MVWRTPSGDGVVGQLAESRGVRGVRAEPGDESAQASLQEATIYARSPEAEIARLPN
jgi:hypothetical protein